MRYRLLLLVVAIGSVSVFLAKGFQAPPKISPRLSQFPVTEQKPFVIIIPSYNNEKYAEKNLRSVFSQDYDNFRVIYIDDNSRDKTLAVAQKLLKEIDPKHRTSLIHNSTNFGALANIYNAVHSCHDQEIVVLLDGDDFLAHEYVLKTLNQMYADPGIWMTYGNYLEYPWYLRTSTEKKSIETLFKKKPEREEITTHLRTFYASIFKEIKIEDLFYRGRFYPMSWDLAFMLPMLEMCNDHAAFVQDVLYLHNRDNPISDHKIHPSFQKECSQHIIAKKSYPYLTQLPIHETTSRTADLIIFSENRPMQLLSLLESIHNYVVGLKKITVLYETKTPQIESLYIELKLNYSDVHFVKREGNLPVLISSTIFDSPVSSSKYILFAGDSLIVTDFIDLSKAVQTLELSKAYGMFLTHHEGLEYSASLTRYEPTPLSVPLLAFAGDDIPFAWQFSSGMDDWNAPNPFSCALFRKEDLRKIFSEHSFENLEELARTWFQYFPSQGIGLYYSSPKSVYLRPSSAVSEQDLLEMFEEGLKIDLTRMGKLKTPSQEIVCDLTFIPRE